MAHCRRRLRRNVRGAGAGGGGGTLVPAEEGSGTVELPHMEVPASPAVAVGAKRAAPEGDLPADAEAVPTLGPHPQPPRNAGQAEGSPQQQQGLAAVPQPLADSSHPATPPSARRGMSRLEQWQQEGKPLPVAVRMFLNAAPSRN